MKTSLFILFATLAPLLLNLMPVVTFADDSKVYNGSACIAYGLENNGPPARFDVNFYMSDGSIKNNLPNNSIFVLCPIVRDNTTNTDGLRNVTVRLFDAGFCIIESRAPFGQTTNDFSKLLEAGPGFQSLEFKDANRLTRSFPLGPYVLSCLLPPGGILFNYLVTEP